MSCFNSSHLLGEGVGTGLQLIWLQDRSIADSIHTFTATMPSFGPFELSDAAAAASAAFIGRCSCCRGFRLPRWKTRLRSCTGPAEGEWFCEPAFPFIMACEISIGASDILPSTAQWTRALAGALSIDSVCPSDFHLDAQFRFAYLLAAPHAQGRAALRSASAFCFS